MSIEINGLHEARKWLEVTAPELSKKLAGDLTLDVATQIADVGRENMPERTGAMKRATKAKRERMINRIAAASVRCGRFYWRFLENGDGPDGIEHAFFLKARERVFAALPEAQFARFTKRLAASFK